MQGKKIKNLEKNLQDQLKEEFRQKENQHC